MAPTRVRDAAGAPFIHHSSTSKKHDANPLDALTNNAKGDLRTHPPVTATRPSSFSRQASDVASCVTVTKQVLLHPLLQRVLGSAHPEVVEAAEVLEGVHLGPQHVLKGLKLGDLVRVDDLLWLLRLLGGLLFVVIPAPLLGRARGRLLQVIVILLIHLSLPSLYAAVNVVSSRRRLELLVHSLDFLLVDDSLEGEGLQGCYVPSMVGIGEVRGVRGILEPHLVHHLLCLLYSVRRGGRDREDGLGGASDVVAVRQGDDVKAVWSGANFPSVDVLLLRQQSHQPGLPHSPQFGHANRNQALAQHGLPQRCKSNRAALDVVFCWQHHLRRLEVQLWPDDLVLLLEP
mmetsp:Transcript_30975/g.77958  ORF Transcript_30975/g.77958 Transcript_30975/m.77958 type:complete len:345 (+) Transcript_30975:20-1054(+)